MSYIRHVTACNQYKKSNFVPFYIDAVQIGMVRPEFAAHLAYWPDVFQVRSDAVSLLLPGLTMAERSSIVAEVLSELVDSGVISHLHGEQYIATPNTRDQGVLLLDRAAAPYFGIRAFGQHINGFIRENGELKLWVSRRSHDRIHYPGRLDNLVAGGLPAGIEMRENLAKECWEEAGISSEMASKAQYVSTITYNMESENGLKPDTLFCYDLELPGSFIPECVDGEVAGFELVPIREVMNIVFESDEFKLNCNLVLIDLFIRHGYLDPEHEEYHDLIAGLHPKLVV